MPKPFDATMRQLLQMEPAAWLELLGMPVPDSGQIQIIDSNLSTVTADVDKLIRVGGPEPYLFHSEFLSGRDLGYPEQLHWYKCPCRPSISIAGSLGAGAAPGGGGWFRVDGGV